MDLTLEEAFGLAKEKISKAFRRLSEQLTESEGFLKDIKSSKQQNVARLGVKMQGIKDVLAGAPMKVVFFGRTSNGNSTVINALLQNGVLPMGIGHTTNCFCSVAGTEEGEGHLVISESAEKQAVEVSECTYVDVWRGGGCVVYACVLHVFCM